MSSEDGSEGQTVPAETLDFLFEYTRGAPQRQLVAMDALDTKAFALFSASAVVVGLAGIGVWSSQELPLAAGILFVLAVAAFVVVGLTVFDCVRLRRYRLSDRASVLWQEFWNDEVDDIKHALVSDIAEAYDINEAILRRKRLSLGPALIAVVVETALSALVSLGRVSREQKANALDAVLRLKPALRRGRRRMRLALVLVVARRLVVAHVSSVPHSRIQPRAQRGRMAVRGSG